MPRRLRGFTLIEVIVALAIAATALILIVSANQDAMRRGVASRRAETVERLVESKLDEIKCGLETRSSGDFEDMQGWSWSVRRRRAEIADLRSLDVLTFKVYEPSSASEPYRVVEILIHRDMAPASTEGQP